jgi:hypothetical protein
MAVTYNIKGTPQSSFKVGKQGAGTVEIGGIDATGNSSIATVTGSLVPSANITYDLGSSSLMWRDLYVGPGSIYVNGKKVIEDNAGTINITTDADQNLTIATSGTGETTMSSAAGLNFSTSSTGDITFTTASGQIEFDGDIIVNAAKSISSSNAEAIAFADPISVTGNSEMANLTVTGNLTVQGTTTTIDSTTVQIQNAFKFEGATDDAFETTLTVTDPTADRTITLPDATGTVVLQDSTDTLTNKTLAGASLTANLDISDGVYLNIGTGNDLRIYHTGTNSHIEDWGDGDLYIKASNNAFFQGKNSNHVIQQWGDFGGNGFTKLRYGNQEVFETVSGGVKVTGNVEVTGNLTFEGATADDYETTLTVTDPTADRTITLPNATGTVVLADTTDTLTNKTLTTPDVNTSLKMVSGAQLQFRDNQSYITENGGILLWNSAAGRGVRMYSNGAERVAVSYDGNLELKTGVDIVFEGATDDGFETTLTVTDPTADRTITLPNATGTVALTNSFTHFHSSEQTVTSAEATTNASGTVDYTFSELSGAIHYVVFLNRTLMRASEYSVSGTTLTVNSGVLATDDQIEVTGISV